ncbi:hypothetical protein Mal4_51940 [Maioricimonas rarisocia]|uniref:Zinc-ribbon domain-containing protein n=1 Tax=Maioricimonas rarisocia TaxID=2528026 RepID=A0A517ZEC7_9PLAN|nr:zinc ribbon domain-containing protein [Maioricimonas rarisocia]QDU40832.1 hypothetical protein Mal4_51940 [Maioricimonas rarisocia]
MSFRTCPACKASVLEDDAELCPFCGASMSGKPTPTPAKAAAPSAPAKKPAAGSAAKPAGKAPAANKAAAKRPAAAEESADSGDPFDVDTAAMRKAFPVQPRPKKGCMVRVVCPMCDTPGFIPEKQQGKDVKCCNPECLVPVYTAPEPEPEETEDEAPAANWTTRIFWGVAGTALVAGLITVYMVVFNAEVDETDPLAVPPIAANDDGEEDPLNDPTGGGTKPEVVVDPPVTPAEIRDEALPEMVKAAQQRDNNRSKPFGRQQAAEAYALVGDLSKARQQLTRLADVGRTVPFYRIGPLVEIARQQRNAGDMAAANATLDKALAVASFPRVGRQPLDAVGNLAAALVINDRLDDATQLVTSHAAGGSRGALSALWQGAMDLKTYNVSVESTHPYLHQMPGAIWVAVTRSVAHEGTVDQAVTWARAADDVSVRDNSLAAWAGVAAARGNDEDMQALDAIAGNSSPTGQTRIWAAVADAQLLAGKTEAAKASLEKADAALASLSVPQPQPLPDMKAIYRSIGRRNAGLPDPAPWYSAALAAADLAELHKRLGDGETAWERLRTALRFTAGTAPGLSATKALTEQNSDFNRASTEQQLKSALGLKDSELFLAFNRYRRQCEMLHDEAQKRFRFEVQLLRRAVRLGMEESVWTLVDGRDEALGTSVAQPYLESTLSGLLSVTAKERGNSELEAAVRSGMAGTSVQMNPGDVIVIGIQRLLQADQFDQIVQILRSYYRTPGHDRYVADREVMIAISQYQDEAGYSAAIDLILQLPDPLIREDCLLLTSARAGLDRKEDSAWKALAKQNLSATERVAAYRGLIGGLRAAGAL